MDLTNVINIIEEKIKHRETGEINTRVRLKFQNGTKISYVNTPAEFKKETKGLKSLSEVLTKTVLIQGEYGLYALLEKEVKILF